MSLWTWSPFQSDEVREICARMTQEERDRAVERSAVYGVWVFFSVIVPVRAVASEDVWIRGLAVAALAVHLALIPLWRRHTRAFLSSTQWARGRGLSGDIKLFKFRRAG